jgi:hypothetical protein
MPRYHPKSAYDDGSRRAFPGKDNAFICHDALSGNQAVNQRFPSRVCCPVEKLQLCKLDSYPVCKTNAEKVRRRFTDWYISGKGIELPTKFEKIGRCHDRPISEPSKSINSAPNSMAFPALPSAMKKNLKRQMYLFLAYKSSWQFEFP